MRDDRAARRQNATGGASTSMVALLSVLLSSSPHSHSLFACPFPSASAASGPTHLFAIGGLADAVAWSANIVAVRAVIVSPPAVISYRE